MIAGLFSALGTGALWVWQSAPIPVTGILLAWLCGSVAVLLVPRDAGPGRIRYYAGTAGLLPTRRRDDIAAPRAPDPGSEPIADIAWLDDRQH